MNEMQICAATLRGQAPQQLPQRLQLPQRREPILLLDSHDLAPEASFVTGGPEETTPSPPRHPRNVVFHNMLAFRKARQKM